MNARSKIAIVMSLFLLAVGMGSANIIDNFGIIEGDASVEGPTFWTDSSESLLLEDPGGQPGPELATDESETWRFYGVYGNEWYKMESNMNVRAKVSSGSEKDNVDLELEIRYLDEDGSAVESNNCLSRIVVDTTDLKNYQTSCETDLSNTSVHGFRYKVENTEARSSVKISQGTETRFEVMPQ